MLKTGTLLSWSQKLGLVMKIPSANPDRSHQMTILSIYDRFPFVGPYILVLGVRLFGAELKQDHPFL